MAKGTAEMIAIGLGRTRTGGKGRRRGDPQRPDSTYHQDESEYPDDGGLRAFARGGYAGLDDGDEEGREGPGPEDEDSGIESTEPESEEEDEGPIDESYEHERMVVMDLVDALGLDPKRVDVRKACEAIRAFHDIDESRERESMGPGPGDRY